MTKLQLIFSSLVLSLVATHCTLAKPQSTQKDEWAYEIKFKVKGAKDTIQLAYYYGDKKLLKDTAYANDKGEFTFTGKKKLSQGVYLVVIPGKGYFDFIANDIQHFSMESDTANLIENMVVKGNPENADFYGYLRFINPKGREIEKQSKKYKKNEKEGKTDEDPEQAELKANIVQIQKDIAQFKKKFIAEHSSYFVAKLFKAMEEISVPEMKEIEDETARREARFNYYKDHYFDNYDLTDHRFLKTPVFIPRFEKFMKEMLLQQCDTLTPRIDWLIAKTGDNYEMFKYIVNWTTNHYEKSKIMCMDCIFLHMAENYYLKDKRVEKWVDSTTMVKIKEQKIKIQYNQCGDRARQMCMKDTNGVTLCLGDVDAEYTLIYFWSATCGHCKKTTPILHEAYKRLKDEYGFEVYSVCIDKDLKEYYKYIKKHKLEWPLLSDPDDENHFRVTYNVFSTPQLYLLDHKKDIIAKRIDVKTLEKMITGTAPEDDKEMSDDHSGH